MHPTHLFPDLPPARTALSDAELAALLSTLLRNAKGGKLTREAEGYLAGVAGEYLAERLALAGVAVVRITS